MASFSLGGVALRLAYITPEFVTESSYAGGLANYLGRLTVALAGAGHDIHVFTRSTDRDDEVEFLGVRVHRVVPRWDHRMILDHIDPWIPRSLYNPYQDLKAAWCLYRLYDVEQQRQPFDLVQLSNVMAVGLFFNHRLTPIVMRLSSYRPEWDRTAGIPITIGVKSRWQMEKWSIQATNFLYAPSAYVAQKSRKEYGLSRVDIVETPFFREEVELNEDEFQKVVGDKTILAIFRSDDAIERHPHSR